MIMFISKVLLYTGFALIICWRTHSQSRWTFVHLSGDAFTLLWSKNNNHHALYSRFIDFLYFFNCRYFRGAYYFFWRGAFFLEGGGLFCFSLFCFLALFLLFYFYQRWETPKLQCILLFSFYCFDTFFIVSFSILITFKANKCCF